MTNAEIIAGMVAEVRRQLVNDELTWGQCLDAAGQPTIELIVGLRHIYAACGGTGELSVADVQAILGTVVSEPA